MKEVFFVFRSVTHGQLGRDALAEAGFRVVLRRSPRPLSSSGCAYAAELRGGAPAQAAAVLDRIGLPYRGPYLRGADGIYTEVRS